MEDIIDSQYPGSEEARIAKKVARVMKLAKEKRAADLLFTGSNFNTADLYRSVWWQVQRCGR